MIVEEPLNDDSIYSISEMYYLQKAQKWLNDNGVSYEEVHIVEQPPTRDELLNLWQASEQPLKKFLILLV